MKEYIRYYKNSTTGWSKWYEVGKVKIKDDVKMLEIKSDMTFSEYQSYIKNEKEK